MSRVDGASLARLDRRGDNRPVFITIAVLLAIFVLPDPWRVPVVGLAVLVEIAETTFWMRRSRRGRVKAGPETMIGELARVVTSCDPIGEVRLHGELWSARCERNVVVGQQVRVRSREGLTLIVEPTPSAAMVLGRGGGHWAGPDRSMLSTKRWPSAAEGLDHGRTELMGRPADRSGLSEPGLDTGGQVRVRLAKAIHPDVEYDAMVISDDGSHIVVRAPWAEEAARDLGFVRFEPGDMFTEHYWRDRWYSVKEVRDGDGVLKGWYCDVARPVSVEGSELVSEDLDLDLWVSADGRTVLRLDEDEFAASGLAETDPHAVSRARDALTDLEHLASQRFRTLARDA